MVLNRIKDFITMNDEPFVVMYDVKASKFDQKRFQLYQTAAWHQVLFKLVSCTRALQI